MNCRSRFYHTIRNYQNQIIEKLDLPVCKDCKYYNKLMYPKETTVGKCYKFGVKNLVTGDIWYEYAEIRRNHHNTCGETGKFFEKK